MKTKSLKQLEKLTPGLPFWSNDDFCKLVKSLPDDAPVQPLRQMLTQAADRSGCTAHCRSTSSPPSRTSRDLGR